MTVQYYSMIHCEELSRPQNVTDDTDDTVTFY